MSTLKVNKLRDTAGSTDAIVLDPNGGAVLAGVTTVTSVKVGAAVTISESGIEASGIGITCANINGTQIGGRRNIIINGAMQVAQRATSSTGDNYKTVDRFAAWNTSVDEAPTQAQADVSSGTTPYTEGFRKSFKITNGNQTSDAQAGSRIFTSHTVEAQDIANSGWNFINPNSFITLSFWVKSSVAGNFYGYLYNFDGTNLGYSYETGSLTADTWTKVIKTIPGNSNLSFNNDNGQGLYIVTGVYWGTNYTDAGNTLNQWGSWSGSSRTPVNATTWYETNDATFEITGVQLEVGSQATPFEHRSFGEELTLCQRYFQSYPHDDNTSAEGLRLNGDFSSVYQTPMRAVPTGVVYGTGGTAGSNNGKYDKDAVGNQNAAIETKGSGFEIDTDGGVGLAAVTLDAEL